MYPATAGYKSQMMRHGTRRRVTGTIGSVPFTGDDIKRESLTITGRATEESDTKIGGVYLGEIELTLKNSFLEKIPRDQLRGKEISVNIGLWIPDPEDEIDGGDWEDIPVGVFTLTAPKISTEGVALHGYDNMKKLDRTCDLDTTTGTPYGYLTYIAEACGITLGQTAEEIMALPNGTEVLGLYSENDIETYRDLLYWLAQSTATFACADRAGNIVLRRFGSQNDIELDDQIELDEDHRDSDVVFSGYTTKWTGITVTDAETNTSRYYGLEIDDGLTMNLGANPFLQMGSAIAVDRRRRNVLEGIAPIQYVPFYTNSARDPIFDLGDEIKFTGGISGESTGVIMAFTYTVNSYTFEGYGDDPDLASARSKTDKDISGLIQTTTENEVVYYNFANLEPITIQPEQETEIASLAFTCAQKTNVKILHEFIFDMKSDLSQDGSYELTYYLDEEPVPYQPYERLGPIAQLTQGDTTETSITRDFYYALKDIEPNQRHVWQVKITTHGISETTIGSNHAHVTLEGQRLYGEDYYGGLIEARDTIEAVGIGNLALVSISDAATVSRTDPNDWIHPQISETVAKIAPSGIGLLQIAEGTGELAPTIYMQGGYPWAAEDGALWVTEDDDRWTTE